MASSLVIRSRRVVTPEGVVAASVHIRDGSIERIADWSDAGSGCEDLGDLVLLPGLVDSHVHVNEPGRTEWEGFETATRAAAAGGVTTIVDMPLNSIPPTTTVDGLRAKLDAMRGKCRVDVGLWGGAVHDNASELRRLVDEGVLGFKCFLVESGVDEFTPLDRDALREALTILRDLDRPMLVHAELPGPIAEAARDAETIDPRRYERFLRSRPARAEDEAIALVAALCEETGASAHIVHLSSASAVPIVRAARASGLSLSAETTPHYLHFAAEEIPDGATELKCAPPIRERDNREQLWDAIADGVIDCIVSDHSPCTPDLKRKEHGDFTAAWGGIASLQFGLPIIWTEASRRGFGLDRVAAWMSAAPARLAGLDARKGAIRPGLDADLVAFDPDAEFDVETPMIEHRNSLTPYAGSRLRGVVRSTWLRGRRIYHDGEHVGAPSGERLRR